MFSFSLQLLILKTPVSHFVLEYSDSQMIQTPGEYVTYIWPKE